MTPQQKRNLVLRRCRERHIAVYELGGQARRLVGNGIDVLVDDLTSVGEIDLTPIMPRHMPGTFSAAHRLASNAAALRHHA
jgi:hypothetical protein